MTNDATNETQSFPGAFCEPCNKWRKPSSLMPDGTCPKCRTQLDDPVAIAEAKQVVAQARADAPRIPWHFWVMVGATAIYLGWRVVQAIDWLF